MIWQIKFEQIILSKNLQKDFNAPNMENGIVKQGSIKFLYGDNISYDNLKKPVVLSDGILMIQKKPKNSD